MTTATAEMLLSCDSCITGMVAAMLRSRGFRCAATIEDVAQQARLRLWSALREGRFQPETGPFEAYAVSAARNTALDWLRSRSRRGASVAFRDDMASTSSVDATDIEDEVAHLRRTLAQATADGRLTPEQSLVIDAWLYHEGNGASAARDLGWSTQTFHNRFKRALEALRCLMRA